MSEKKGKTHNYKEAQHGRAKDRWIKKNPSGLSRKDRRALAKRIKRAR